MSKEFRKHLKILKNKQKCPYLFKKKITPVTIYLLSTFASIINI